MLQSVSFGTRGAPPGGKGQRTGVGQDRNQQHPRRFAMRQLESLPAHDVQDGQRNPQDKKREGPDQTAKGHGEDHAAPRTRAFGRAGVFLVQDLVETVEDTADADDDVAPGSAFCFAVLDRAAADGAAGFAAVFGGRGVAVRDYEHACDGYCHGEGFVEAEFVFQKGDAEGVGKEGRTVVDGRQVARGCEVDGYVP